ncbi:Cyclin N-terminal domain-containing protein [Mycena kentingensis (nom. inval.)]|nr:Cyclin N-terminal domain-containing protein [Mycena kentingensis (nom. inval.)]
MSLHSRPLHPASLVYPVTHSREIMQLVGLQLTSSVIGECTNSIHDKEAYDLSLEYMIKLVKDTVDYALGGSLAKELSLPCSVPPTSFSTFVTKVLKRAEVSTATVLVALVYISRARDNLLIDLDAWVRERIFLGALVVASKYANDSTLKNVHWAMTTDKFGKRDIGLVEREFISVLDWDLGVQEADLLAHYEGLMKATDGWVNRGVACEEVRSSGVPGSADSG